MKTVVAAVLAFLIGALAMRQWNARDTHSQTNAHVDDDDAKKAESKESHETNSVPGLKLDADTQERIGLKTAIAQGVNVAATTETFGRVLDPGPLLALGTELETAEAAAAASEREWVRTKGLFDQDQNASARMLEQALAATLRDRATVAGIRARIASSWSPAFTGMSDLKAFLQKVARGETVLLRIDVPPDRALAPLPESALVQPVGYDVAPVRTKSIGVASTVDPQVLGSGFIAQLDGTPMSSGTALKAWIPSTNGPQPLVQIPASAVIRVAGDALVYVRSATNRFQRRVVELATPNESGWLIRTGLTAGDTVVTSGAQQLLSAESKTEAPE